jgi:uncharacterized membrane protein SpoIIM required for sporulation
MNLDRFLHDREPSWSELRTLVGRAKGRPERLGPARLRRLGQLYRAAAADLALARRRFPGDPVVADLADLVGRARHLVYAGEARRESVVDFLRHGYWRRVRERPVALLVAAVLLLAPMAVSTVWALDDPGAAAGVVPGQFGGVTDRKPEGPGLGLPVTTEAALSTQIFTNNIRVALAAFAGGISAGLLTAAALLFNGLLLGVVTGLAVGAGNAAQLVQLTVPHGVLELSCIVVAGAAGLRLGWAVVAPGRRPRAEALVAEAGPAVELALGTAPWLVVAGLVEGFVTPSGVGVVPALLVGCGLGAVYWGLVWRWGRPGDAMASGTAGLRAEPATSS